MFRLLQINLLLILVVFILSCGSPSENKMERNKDDSQIEMESKKEYFLFYPGEDLNLHPFSVYIEKRDNKASEIEAILTEYFNQSPANGLINPFPQNAKLKAVYLLGEDRAVVDLSSMCVEGGGAEEETFRIYGIVNTLNFNFPEIKAVKIIIEGQERETFMGHIDISGFIPPESSLNGKGVK